jgi:hypothetical protein
MDRPWMRLGRDYRDAPGETRAPASQLVYDFVTGRFDHNFNSKRRADASFGYSRRLGYNWGYNSPPHPGPR